MYETPSGKPRWLAGWKRNHDSSCFASQNQPFFFAYGRVKKSFQWSWAGWPLCSTSSESCETTFGDPLWDGIIHLLFFPLISIDRWVYRNEIRRYVYRNAYRNECLDWSHKHSGHFWTIQLCTTEFLPRLPFKDRKKNSTGSKVESFNLPIRFDITGII